jgi:hypothetical protein
LVSWQKSFFLQIIYQLIQRENLELAASVGLAGLPVCGSGLLYVLAPQKIFFDTHVT